MNKLIITILLLIAKPLQVTFAQTYFKDIEDLNFIGYGTEKEIIDYNQDGKLDFIYTITDVIYFLESIDGKTFKEPISIYQSDNSIYTISNFEDINSDGNLDMAVYTANNQIEILYGNNNLTLTNNEDINHTTTYGYLLQWIDIDNDGNLDLIMDEDFTIKVIYDYYNMGSDSKEIFFDNNGKYVVYTNLQDINKDGLTDVAISSTSDFGVYLQNNDNSFSPIYSLAKGFIELETNDFNKDGYNDLMFLNEDYSNIDILTYQSNTNDYTASKVFDTDLSYISNFGTGDINLDGKTDLVVDTQIRLNYVLGNGDGTFANLTNVTSEISNTPSFNTITVADMNNDTNPDIISEGTNSYAILFMDNSLAHTETKPIVFITDTRDFASTKLDNDAGLDYISFGTNGDVRIDWTTDNITIDETTHIEIGLGLTHGSVFDYDGDDDLDIFYSIESNNNSINSTWVIENLGNKNFESPEYFKYFPNALKPIIMDKTNSGTEKMLYAERAGNSLYWLDQTNNDTNEYFSTSDKYTLSEGDGILEVAIGHLSDDDFIDMVTANSNSNNYSILINNTAGSFNESSISIGDYTPTGVSIIDFNEDGRNDIIVLGVNHSTGNNLCELFEMSEDYILESIGTIPVNNIYEPTYVYSNDFDNDGILELMVSSFDNSQRTLFEKNQEGLFIAAPEANLQSAEQASMTFEDINDDNKLDMVYAQWNYSNIKYQINESVEEPGAIETTFSIDNSTYESFEITMNDISYSGRMIIIKEGSTINKLLIEDGQFYSSNTSFGVGYEIEESAFVVYTGNENNITVDKLNGDSEYHVYIIEYNTNEPNNTTINYSSEFEVVSTKTEKALFKLSDISDQTINQSETLTLQLDDYFNNQYELNIYSAISDKEAVAVTTTNDNQLIINPNTDFFGNSTITITITNRHESLETFFNLTVEEVPVTSSIDEMINTASIRPNPASDMIIISEGNQVNILKVFDLLGNEYELKASNINNTTTVDVSKLPVGVYIIQIDEEKFRFVKE